MSNPTHLAACPVTGHVTDYGPASPQRPDSLRHRRLGIRSALSERWWAVMRSVAIRGTGQLDLWVERHGDNMMRRLSRHPARGI